MAAGESKYPGKMITMKLAAGVGAPDGLDATDVSRGALDHNVVLAPGNAFSLGQAAQGHLRFNVSQSDDDRIFAVLQSATASRSA